MTIITNPTMQGLINYAEALTARIEQGECPDNDETCPTIGDFCHEWSHIHSNYDYEPPFELSPDCASIERYLDLGWKNEQAHRVGPIIIIRLYRYTDNAIELWVGPVEPEIRMGLEDHILRPYEALRDWLSANGSGEIPADLIDALDLSPDNPFALSRGRFHDLRLKSGTLPDESAITALINEAQFPALIEALQRLAEATQKRNEQTFRNRQPRRTDDKRTATLSGAEKRTEEIRTIPPQSGQAGARQHSNL